MLKGISQAKGTVKSLINNKAQALVEFVLILPIILMILFVIIDFARVYYERNHLESILNDVVYMVKEDKSKEDIEKVLGKDITYDITKDNEYLNISLNQDIMLVTPFSNLFFDNPYHIKLERTIINE